MLGATDRSRAPLRVAFYTDADERGGAEVSLRTLLEHLPEDVAATVVGTDQDLIDWVAGVRADTQAVVVPAVGGKTSLGPILAHRRALARLRPHVVHCNLNEMADARWAVLAATTLRHARVIAVEHSPIAPIERSVMVLKRLGSRRLAAHVAVGEWSARATEAAVGLAAGSVRTIHNGVPERAAPGPPRERQQDGMVVGTLARLDPLKGLDRLVTAAARLDGIRVLIIGEGPQRAALEEQVRQLGVEERVDLRGWDDQPRRALDEMDVFALPSDIEGFPLSIVEAMLAGLPVVASDVGSVGEAVVHDHTGYLVAPGDIDGLTAALERLTHDPECRARFGAAGRARALERFTARRMADAYVALYREVVER